MCQAHSELVWTDRKRFLVKIHGLHASTECEAMRLKCLMVEGGAGHVALNPCLDPTHVSLCALPHIVVLYTTVVQN